MRDFMDVIKALALGATALVAVAIAAAPKATAPAPRLEVDETPVARAAGPDLLSNADWLLAFARATQGALAKPVVRIDLQTMAISY